MEVESPPDNSCKDVLQEVYERYAQPEESVLRKWRVQPGIIEDNASPALDP